MLKTITGCLRFAADLLIPRLITEDVALEKVGPGLDWDNYEIVCSMIDVQPGEVFDGIAEVNSFTWLGFGITYSIGNYRPWSAQSRQQSWKSRQ